ncbi:MULTISPECIES: hypothetical protein [Serratia]|uniref:Uncharacterized protein n=1 Tax=Serratia quinivorans TaxID=137545 RepID=A0A379YDE3_9GAMM|nr:MULTISPECIES: hypothetical protein [Serratia]RYM55412.1 hypothetical protein BSR03_27315 [Serratia proteamaculans]CAI1717795.1 Uncharacterised protein [Serratia quinivorans]SUI43926.1 Uncharacterised protein [Serratia quinivorans]
MYILMILLLATVFFLYVERRHFKLQADYLEELAGKRASVIAKEYRIRECIRSNMVGVWLELDANEDINRRYKNNEVADAYAKCRELLSVAIKEDTYLAEGKEEV